MKRVLSLLIMILFGLMPVSAATVRIMDIAHIQGVRENQLVGYGLVVGLPGTGDNSRSTQITNKMMLRNLGTVIEQENYIQKGASAAVIVTATVPAFADVTPFSSLERLENDIMPLSIFPSMDARLLEGIVDLSPKAIILEGFGVGGILYQLFPAVTRAVSCKIPVVIRTQALCGGTDLNMYDLGLKTAALGAISSGNMTREALIAKLKVALPLCSDNASLEKMLNTNYCDDIVVEDKAEC